MSKRKQTLNPIEYKERPPAWKLLPKKKKVREPENPKPLEETTLADYEEIICEEAEQAELLEAVFVKEEIPEPTEAEVVVQVVCKDRTREFIQKEMDKLMLTLDQLVEYDDHAFVVNFVLEMSGQAKKKLWELQGLSK